jgi:hypothetical protein
MPKLSISIQVDQNGQHAISSYGDPSLWPFVGRLAACYHPQKTSADGADARAQDSKADIALATLGWSGFGDIQRWAEAVRECALRGEDYLAARAVSEATAAPIRERLRLPESTTPLEVLVAVANCHAAKADAVRGLESQVNKIDAVLRPLVTSDEDDDGLEQVADLVAERIRSLEGDDVAVRRVLEEAIGRTPDPSRSTPQLAHDLATLLKTAIDTRG